VQLRSDIGAVYTRMQTAADALKADQIARAKTDYEGTERTHRWFLIGTFGVVIVGALSAFWSWRLLRGAILRPANEAILHFERIAPGNLSHDIAVRSKDEMGRMMAGLLAMQHIASVYVCASIICNTGMQKHPIFTHQVRMAAKLPKRL
jgi:methyl-accepting chemotaxis protein I, serine sensor receptor